jgi:hypothetical protein
LNKTILARRREKEAPSRQERRQAKGLSAAQQFVAAGFWCVTDGSKVDACYGERLVQMVLTGDIGDVAPTVLPVRINDRDFREKIQVRA